MRWEKRAAQLQMEKEAGTKSSLALLLLPSDAVPTRALFYFCATMWDKADEADLGAAGACSNLDCIN